MTWRGLPPPRRRTEAAGFLLPLASGTALVLLLTGLSLQTAVLHQRELAAEALRQRQGEDALASAAHRLVAQLDGPYRHLLPLPLTHWPPTEKEALEASTELKELLGLQVWTPPSLEQRPSQQPAQLQLTLLRPDGAGLAEQRRFLLMFDPDPNGSLRPRRLMEVGS